MKGESRGDFSRDTFDPGKHFLRVLMQQGRVSLDADWNEQTDILLHYLQTLSRDLIGPFAGPEDPDERGFDITPANGDANALSKGFNISPGRYYVDGILCENPEEINYYAQLDFPREANPVYIKDSDLPLLVYLDVWERHISYIEDDCIREKALGVADTASRSRVVWQVKVLKSGDDNDGRSFVGEIPSKMTTPEMTICEAIRLKWSEIVKNLLQNPRRGCLKACAKETAEVSTDPCVTSPESRYRGKENQLYRVEIHRGGPASKEDGSNESQAPATFKWSRDNGTVAFPIISKTGNIVVLEHLGRDDRLSLKKGDWVEVIDDDYTLLIQSRPSPLTEIRPLAQVDSVDTTEMSVTLRLQDSSDLPDYDYPEDSSKHPLLRRWDHKVRDPTEQDEPKMAEDDGALYVEENKPLTLEDGIQIWFEESNNTIQNYYQRGDYWLIPARTATGDVEWPEDPKDGKPLLLPPHGIDHHYAPLAVIRKNDDSGWKMEDDCRCKIKRALIAPCVSEAE